MGDETVHARHRAGSETASRPQSLSVRSLLLRALLALLLLGALGMAVDLLLTHGKTARGAQIAEFPVGNLTPDEARAELKRLSVAAASPVVLHTESGQATVDPSNLGLSFDPNATLDRLLEQPRNPWQRLLAMVGVHHEVEPVVHLDQTAFNEELDAQRRELERAAVEGGVHFDGTEPVADMPSSGLRVNRAAAQDTLRRQWLTGTPVTLAMEPFAPTVSAEVVQNTLDGPARTVTSSGLRLSGRGQTVAVTPGELGEMVVFVPDGKGGLAPSVSQRNLKRVLGEDLARTESSPEDARFVFSGGKPQVVASQEGATVKAKATAAALAAASVTDQRKAEIAYTVTKPKLDTKKAKSLGIREVISEYTTGDFSGPSGENIRLVAETVDGAVVLPGETFSLNGYTGPRGTAQGYVTSTIIDHGRASKAVGGGISQFATTLYNAAYFAGLEDVAHTEHDYYISRYPAAREATVFEGAIDLQFRNNTDHGILIETEWTPSSITVRMWGTKTVEVESIPGERYNQTSPEQVVLPAGDDCLPSSGSPGFTTSDTRVVRDARTGEEISRSTRTKQYAPEPNVVCR